MPDLAGTTVLVAGGGRGVERAVEALAENGARVVLQADNDVESGVATALADSLDGVTVLDSPARSFADAAALVDGVVSSHGSIDVLLLPVPPRTSEPIDSLDLDAWAEAVEAVTKRSVGLTQAFARHRIAQGGRGHVVTFSSSSVFARGGVGQASVNAAVLSLTSGVATTLVPHDIAVNCVVLGGDDSFQGGVPEPDVDSDQLLGSLVVHLATVDPSFTGKFVYCAGRDVGIYAMPLVIEQAHVLVRMPDEPGPDQLGELLAPLADVGRV